MADVKDSEATNQPQGVSIRFCIVVLLVGFFIASLPSLLPIHRKLDKFLFGTGAAAMGNAVLGLLFAEIREGPQRGRIRFRTRLRMISAVVVAMGIMGVIITCFVMARSQGWWR